MPTALITGANRGIGLEFARQYADTGWEVIATARQSSPELDALGVRVATLELTHLDAVTTFGQRIDGPLDLLIANAGVMQPREPKTADEARGWVNMLTVNSIAPYLLARSCLDQLADAEGKAIAISSGMGSIGDNGGDWVPYRTSKAALNMAWSSLALEARPRGVTCVLLSPGWVRTRMGGAGAELSPEESVGDMRTLIERLTIEDSGRFLRRNGSELPW